MEVFSIHGPCGHSLSCDLDHFIKVSFPLPMETPRKLWPDWSSSYGENLRKVWTTTNGHKRMSVL